MNADAWLGWLLQGALAVGAALLLVLALRLPLRRFFGARIAYLAWGLVPLSLLAASLPAPHVDSTMPQFAPLLAMPTAIVDVAHADASPVTSATHSFDVPALITFAWAVGALSCALYFRSQQRRFVASLGQLRRRQDGTWLADADQCPVVIGAWRARIVLPADFDTRYTPEQAALVIAHERMHVARGDVRANLVVAVLRCAHWFNPLLHACVVAFRADQELACDAGVVARHTAARRAYGDAMLNTQLAGRELPVGCHWQSAKGMKERIVMLKKPLPTRARARAGVISLTVALGMSTYAAWALQPAVLDQGPTLAGKRLFGSLANVDIATDRRLEPVSISGGSMSSGADARIRVSMNSLSPLNVSIGDQRDGLRFEAHATDTVADYPVVVWTLMQATRRIGEGRLRLTGKPQVLVIGGAAQHTASSTTLTFQASIGPTIQGKALVLPLDANSNADFRAPDGVLVGDYKVTGSIDLLLQVSADGHVARFEVERESPAGAMRPEDIEDYVNSLAFRPRIEDGKPVASLVRTTVRLSPLAEQKENLQKWLQTGPEQQRK